MLHAAVRRWPSTPRPCASSALVTGNTYRAPTLLAKTLTTLDLVSRRPRPARHRRRLVRARARLARLRVRHASPTASRSWRSRCRSSRACSPASGRASTASGTRSSDAINSPAPLSKIPIMIGGSGEKKTLRLVAQYADESNLICDARRRSPASSRSSPAHCDAVGRDRSEITVSLQAHALHRRRPTSEAVAELDALLASRGIDVSSMGAEDAAAHPRRSSPTATPTRSASDFSDRLAPRRRRLHRERGRQRPHPGPRRPPRRDPRARWSVREW